MRPTACLMVDDVLMTASGQRSIAGHSMLTALMFVYDVVLLTRDPDLEHVESWLYQNGIGGHAALLYIEVGNLVRHRDIAYFANQLRHGYKYPIELFVVGDPNHAAALFDEGYLVTLFMHPAYTRPEWRPTAKQEITPWDEIAAFMSAEAALAAADERTKDE